MVKPDVVSPRWKGYALGVVANHFDVVPARTNDMSLSHNGKNPLEQLRLSPKGRQFRRRTPNEERRLRSRSKASQLPIKDGRHFHLPQAVSVPTIHRMQPLVQRRQLDGNYFKLSRMESSQLRSGRQSVARTPPTEAKGGFVSSNTRAGGACHERLSR